MKLKRYFKNKEFQLPNDEIKNSKLKKEKLKPTKPSPFLPHPLPHHHPPNKKKVGTRNDKNKIYYGITEKRLNLDTRTIANISTTEVLNLTHNYEIKIGKF